MDPETAMQVPAHTRQTYCEGTTQEIADVSASARSVLGAQLAGAHALPLEKTAGGSSAPAELKVGCTSATKYILFMFQDAGVQCIQY